ncbi:Omp28-related outer membrane protein [Psychroserpens sp.]|uniref:Omp28-related outer membrane protein n=1 Tax=Psychroserpens sp. TaxID=2020870 RepID=UPI002B275C09|nr:Omp28-related outer membrane protein [Psychroserpens sp.]
MKVNHKLKFLLALFISASMAVVSCSSSDENTSGDGGGGTATSIVLSADATAITVGNPVTFSVVDDLGNNVTAQTTFKVDGITRSNPYVFTTPGSHDVIATYGSLTSNTVTVVVSTEDDLTLVFAQNPINVNEDATFIVYDSLGADVSASSTFTVDGNAVSNPHQFVAEGEYTVVANYNALTASNTINVVKVFTKKALLEDFTGTWCPNCPPAASAISSALNTNSNVFGVGYHDGFASYPDPMEIPETGFWATYYNVTGFPTVYVNGPDTRWDFPNMAQVNAELSETATCGLALDASISGGMLNVEVKVGFNALPGEEVKLMLYLIEDNVTTASAQAGSSQGSSYVHKDVLREVYTDQLGDVIPAGGISLTQDYVRNFTNLALPANIDNMANLKVIAFVRNTYTKTFTDYFNEVHTNSPHYDIYNVQEVEVGSSIDFD